MDLFSDMSHVCPHQYYPNAASWRNITIHSLTQRDIPENHTHNFLLETRGNLNSSRNLMFKLEPCHGVIFLYIRKLRPCWPNPWTDEWVHAKSVTDGSNDGGTTLLYLPSEVTRWFITVFGKSSGSYSLTAVLSDPFVFPVLRDESIYAEQINSDTIELRWISAASEQAARFSYTVYASMYFETGENRNEKLLLSPARIMNTVCGLKRNTDHAYSVVTSCDQNPCSTNVTSLSKGRKYVFNIVATDQVSGLKTAYGGILVESNWDDSIFGSIKQTLKIIGTILGTIELALSAAFFLLYHKFG
jgi:hypothetical protein